MLRDKCAPAPVTLHIYNLGSNTQAVNSLLRKLGTGAFHCGVEVFGIEWSFSDVSRLPGEQVEGTGIFCCTPKRCEGHSYCESIPMGKTSLSEFQVVRLLHSLEIEWPVSAYSTLRNNCCHFSEAFCQHLGVGSLPLWVKNLAGAGAALMTAGEEVCSRSTVMGRAATSTVSALCCGPMEEAGRGGDKGSEVVNVDVVEALPVLSPMRSPRDRADRSVLKRARSSSSDSWGKEAEMLAVSAR